MVIQGVIRPPPEIRAVADRTALYVAKNGRAFEQRILGSEKGRTPKFAFLHGTSPFHAYYEQRVQFYENGGEDEKEGDNKKKEEAEQQAMQKKTEEKSAQAAAAALKRKTENRKASVIDPIAKALLDQRSKILKYQDDARVAADAAAGAASETEAESQNKPPLSVSVVPPPPTFQFVNIIPPASISVAQMETIQLVAQFTALDGKHGTFLSQLTHREWNNPAFAFCQPRHGHFAYFSALVDAYRHILNTWTATAESKSATTIEDKVDIKHLANNVEKCLEQAAYRAEYERFIEEARHRDELDNSAAQIDWHDFVVVETIDFPADEIVEPSMMPPPPPPPPLITDPTLDVASKPVTGEMEESDDDDDDDDEEDIRVVPTYTPKIVTADSQNKMETVIDPITGKAVAIKDMPEHMRIQLLDPKWAEERKKFQEKQRDSNLVSGDVVATNLARLAQARGDAYKEHEMLTQETEAKKRKMDSRDPRYFNSNHHQQQQQQQQEGLTGPMRPGPMLLPPPQQGPPHAGMSSFDPASKRQKMDGGGVAPLPLHPLLKTTVVPAPPFPSRAALPPPPGYTAMDPFATAATAEESIASATTATTTPASASASTEKTAAATSFNKEGTAGELLSEADFAASLPNPEVTLQIRIPNDHSQMVWNFYGQIVSQAADVMATIKTVKQALSKTHLNDMPVNKIQLKSTVTGMFLKDNMTLGALNMGPTAVLEMVPRARGGRK